ncbi:carboxypeptidase-like regulatory domain-containing protein [Bacteroidota bacterium]
MKKIFTLLFLLFIFILIYISCNKKHDDTISIAGTVFDPKINSYVQDATVSILSSRIEDGNYNPNYQVITSTQTDAGGNFSFEFKEEKVIGYRIKISKNLYFDNTIDIQADDLSPGETYNPSYHIFPQGFIKLHVKNAIPFDNDDKIAYNFSDGYLNCMDCCGKDAINGDGMLYEKTTICKTYGNQNVTISWTVRKNANTFSNNATIFCLAFDTVSYDINY